MNTLYIKTQNDQYELSEGKELTIGRVGHKADIEISDSSVSRQHGIIKLIKGKVYIKDLESLNGVLLNDRKIKPQEWVEVNSSDQIKVVSEHIYLVDRANGNIDLEPVPGSKPKTEFEEKLDSKDSTVGFKESIKQKGEFIIGRQGSNDIVLDDPTVSRLHAKIAYENGEFWVEDLGSTNKTYVNGNQLDKKTKLRSSDDVAISFYAINLLEGFKDLREESAAIQAIAIGKQYPNNKIGLQSLSLDIPHANFAALMGPSGCGKSTLLKCLNGDNPATSGEVFIHGRSLKKNFNLIKKKIGYVPQDDIIHKELTVYKTLYYAAKLRLPDDTSNEEINRRIDKVIGSLNLEQDKDKDVRGIVVGDLSGGQRKRISIAVELLTEPTILFLDEPTSPLDPETIESFLKSLQNLASGGTTIIMVTHKPEDLNYVDQVIFLGVQGYLTYKGSSKLLTTHFEVENIVEVYSKMSDPNEVSKYYQKPKEIVYETQNAVEIKRDKPDSLILQLYWLATRYLNIKLNDRGNLLLLLAQPIIIAGLVCTVFNELRIGVLFLMAISAIWFGVSNSAKEIVGELSIYRRERMFNININTYILSKWVILSLIALIQTIIFVSIIYWKFKTQTTSEFPEIYLREFWQSVLFMFYISFSASLIGLLLSSYFDTTEKVMSVVPITLMPQIMLAGVMTKLDNALVEVFSFTMLGRWGTEGFSRIQDTSFLDSGIKEEKLQSVIIPMPTAPLENQTESCNCQATGALNQLGLYDEKLIDDGTLIGEIFNSMDANLMAIGCMNLIVYSLIYYSLKNKDSI